MRIFSALLRYLRFVRVQVRMRGFIYRRSALWLVLVICGFLAIFWLLLGAPIHPYSYLRWSTGEPWTLVIGGLSTNLAIHISQRLALEGQRTILLDRASSLVFKSHTAKRWMSLFPRTSWGAVDPSRSILILNYTLLENPWHIVPIKGIFILGSCLSDHECKTFISSMPASQSRTFWIRFLHSSASELNQLPSAIRDYSNMRSYKIPDLIIGGQFKHDNLFRLFVNALTSTPIVLGQYPFLSPLNSVQSLEVAEMSQILTMAWNPTNNLDILPDSTVSATVYTIKPIDFLLCILWIFRSKSSITFSAPNDMNFFQIYEPKLFLKNIESLVGKYGADIALRNLKHLNIRIDKQCSVSDNDTFTAEDLSYCVVGLFASSMHGHVAPINCNFPFSKSVNGSGIGMYWERNNDMAFKSSTTQLLTDPERAGSFYLKCLNHQGNLVGFDTQSNNFDLKGRPRVYMTNETNFNPTMNRTLFEIDLDPKSARASLYTKNGQGLRHEIFPPAQGQLKDQSDNKWSMNKNSVILIDPLDKKNISYRPFKVIPLCCMGSPTWSPAEIRAFSHDPYLNTGRNSILNDNFENSREATCDAYIGGIDFIETLVKLISYPMPETYTKTKYSITPHNWILHHHPICEVDCESPLGCINDGKCRCVRSTQCQWNKNSGSVFPAISSSNPNSDIPASWVNVLREEHHFDPLFQGRLFDKPSTSLKFHVLRLTKSTDHARKVVECHELTKAHCFQVDSHIFKAILSTSVPSDQADYYVVPFYQGCLHNYVGVRKISEMIREFWEDIIEIPAYANIRPSQTLWILSHDVGSCGSFSWSMRGMMAQGVDQAVYPLNESAAVWQTQGDMHTRCHLPHQQTVIPPLSCATRDLMKRFGDPSLVTSFEKRSVLAYFHGSPWGDGWTTRYRLSCPKTPLQGRKKYTFLRNEHAKGKDYLGTLGLTKFCPLPRGVAGWSPRMSDAIYAGCIPVLISDKTDYPFSEWLDYSSFSITIPEARVYEMEEILTNINEEEGRRLFANLMIVRELFVYAIPETPLADERILKKSRNLLLVDYRAHAKELDRVGPLFFPLRSLERRRLTLFPT